MSELWTEDIIVFPAIYGNSTLSYSNLYFRVEREREECDKQRIGIEKIANDE